LVIGDAKKGIGHWSKVKKQFLTQTRKLGGEEYFQENKKSRVHFVADMFVN
jgi:hypothetical protein